MWFYREGMVKDQYSYGRLEMEGEIMITVTVTDTQIQYIVCRFPVPLNRDMFPGTVKLVAQH